MSEKQVWLLWDGTDLVAVYGSAAGAEAARAALVAKVQAQAADQWWQELAEGHVEVTRSTVQD